MGLELPSVFLRHENPPRFHAPLTQPGEVGIGEQGLAVGHPQRRRGGPLAAARAAGAKPLPDTATSDAPTREASP